MACTNDDVRCEKFSTHPSRVGEFLRRRAQLFDRVFQFPHRRDTIDVCDVIPFRVEVEVVRAICESDTCRNNDFRAEDIFQSLLDIVLLRIWLQTRARTIKTDDGKVAYDDHQTVVLGRTRTPTFQLDY
jgi:hypothetical protein